MKIYRSGRELLEEVERALSAKPLAPGGHLPLQEVARSLQQGRCHLAVAIYLNAGHRLVLQALAGVQACPYSIAFGEGVVGKVAQERRTRVVPEVSSDKDYRKVLPQTRAELAQPIETPGRLFGVINAESDQQYAFGREDQVLLKAVAAKLALFLAGRGNYLMHRSRLVEPSQSTTAVKPQASSSAGENARQAVAGRRTAR